MSKRKPANVPASVQARLLGISKERSEDFTLTLVRYAAERFLFRLSRSRYAREFILKGAMLLSAQAGSAYRSTRDLDFLQQGDSSLESVRAALAEVAAVDGGDDGLTFVSESLEVEEIRLQQEYGGWRASLQARLDTARFPLQIDIA